ncbi:MAG: GNAT family N-acetyltransferase [Pseudomonadota bacterium]
MRDLAPGDAGWILMRHAEHYVDGTGFDATFEPLVARVLADFVDARDPAKARGWIAVGADGRRLGSILCADRGDGDAQLRLFFVEPDVRRAGLGRRLLWACIAFAQAAGYRRLCLFTHAEQAAACALYKRAGFAITGSEATRSFGVDATVEAFTLDLDKADAARAALLQ